MGIKRIVDTSFWTDGKVDDFSPEDKYFMLYLLTNPFTKQLGIYEISIKQAAFQMGYSVEALNVLLDRFENKYKMILFSRETSEIAILNFLRHSVMKGGKPVEDCIKKEMTLVKNKKLIDRVFTRLYGRSELNETVKNIINEYIIENDIDNDNDNDNENERSGDESLHDLYPDSSKEPTNPPEPVPVGEKKSAKARFTPPTLEDVTAYCLERGKGVDPEKWHNHYTANGWMVGKNKMVDWKAAVRTWEQDQHSKPDVVAKKGGRADNGFETSNPFLEMLNERRNER